MSLAHALCLRRNLNTWSKNISHAVFSDDQKLLLLLKSCNGTSEISQIHCYMVKTALDLVPFTSSKLLASAILDIKYAASIFRDIRNPNLFMFNTLLRGYSNSDDSRQAFVIFNDLRNQNFLPDEFSFITILKACARELAINTGQGIHGIVHRTGHGLFNHVNNVLLHFYCSCGQIADARKLFDDVSQRNDLVSWNTLMSGYLHASQPTVVLDFFRQMCGRGLISVNTVLTVSSAVGDAGNSLDGRSLHGHCIKVGLCSGLSVVTCLIDMYAKFGDLVSGQTIFDEVAEKDVILWNCLIDNYARNGMLEKAVFSLHLMKLEGIRPNSSTLAGLLSACATFGVVSTGKYLGNYVEEEGLAVDAVLGTALVDMYAKCGFLDKAIDIFDKIEDKDVKSWTAMITGYGAHGQTRKAIRTLYEMEDEGFQPNEITFLAVLNACSHGGVVVEGMRCFKRMVYEYGMTPKIEHYGCIIDLLGRAGLLEEAHNLIKNLPSKGDITGWRALLAACRVYGDVELGESVKRMLVDLNDEHPTDSVLLSSTYAIAGRLSDYTRTQQIKEENRMKEETRSSHMQNETAKKEAGRSIIEMENLCQNHLVWNVGNN
ncbi:pentatricopeptide repeat-containing protein At1g26900, mitochondrial [Momordica charantia]|uniref:Pentatricopeptide repeat-containing protein At1g26900, mitochondrial n=1 Tax=Momordica charantia TaxID=3673 RepID=A0A6J1DA73_MOMCH|nr:pentatricopeptide repeat-containing protein At1g26900, mitochondrial [Momordica charantia]